MYYANNEKRKMQTTEEIELPKQERKKTEHSAKRKFASHHHHHHVVPPARISLTVSPQFSLSFIASGRSSGLHPVSSQSCCMYVRGSRPAFARPCKYLRILETNFIKQAEMKKKKKNNKQKKTQKNKLKSILDERGNVSKQRSKAGISSKGQTSGLYAS